jgi:hypothetical protein
VTTPAGYSGTPLAKKLGIKPEHEVALVDAPDSWSVPDPPPGVHITRDGPAAAGRFDIVITFVREASALGSLDPLGRQIFPDGAVWVAWPRKASGHVSDVTENGIRDVALPLGLVDTKVAALDEDWSGLKLVWRKELRRR